MDVPAPGQQIVYDRYCSIGLGITLIILGCLLIALGIIEFYIPPFASRGYIFAGPWICLISGVTGVIAGCKVYYNSVCCSMIAAIICALLAALSVILMLIRIIVVIVAILLSNSDRPRYEYIFNHTYFENGTIDDYDYDPERIPIEDRIPWEDVDYNTTGIVFGVETIALLAACIIAIILSVVGCKTVCCGETVITPAPVVVMQQDGVQAQPPTTIL